MSTSELAGAYPRIAQSTLEDVVRGRWHDSDREYDLAADLVEARRIITELRVVVDVQATTLQGVVDQRDARIRDLERWVLDLTAAAADDRHPKPMGITELLAIQGLEERYARLVAAAKAANGPLQAMALLSGSSDAGEKADELALAVEAVS